MLVKLPKYIPKISALLILLLLSIHSGYSQCDEPVGGIQQCSTNVSCPDKEDGSASIQIVGEGFGADDIEYDWSNGETGSSISGLAAGVYSVDVKDKDTQCGKNFVFTIGVEESCEDACETSPESCFEIDVVLPKDPNLIIGPPGYGPDKWIAVQDKVYYKVLYENDPNVATAAAQNVFIEVPLGPEFDLFSFRLGSFGFGDFIFEVPPDQAYYKTRVDVADSLGVLVDITAAIDLQDQKAIWILRSIDPETEQPTLDPILGFLLVNDDRHRGEGFVKFSIDSKDTNHTGDTIQAQASIVFDINEAILTNIEKHLLDALPPTSSVESAEHIENSETIRIQFNGQDDEGGSGIGSFDLFYSENDNGFELYQAGIQANTFDFQANLGSKYDFFSIATDNVGYREAMKGESEITTTTPSILLNSDVEGQQFCVGNALVISWKAAAAIENIQLGVSSDGGENVDIITTLPAASNSFEWIIPEEYEAGDIYTIHIADADGPAIAMSDAFEVVECSQTERQLTAQINKSEYCVGDVITIAWQSAGIEKVNIAMVDNEGNNLATIATEIDASLLEYYWPIPDSFTAGSGQVISVSDINGQIEGLSESMTIKPTTACVNGLQNPALFQITVHPNPNDGNFDLEIIPESSIAVGIEITDVVGVVVHHESVEIRERYHKTFSLKNLASGVYIINIITEEDRFTKKMVLYK